MYIRRIYLQGNSGEADIENRLRDMGRGEGEMYGKSNMETYITICKIDSQQEFARETQTGSLYQPRGVECGGRWEEGSKGRGYMYTYG